MDTESLQKIERRRGGCLDVFLVVSIIFLFVAVSAVAVAGVMVVMQLRSELDTSAPVPESQSLKIRDTASPAYKMQNFAYLEATDSSLRNYTMSWVPVAYGTGNTVGSNFIFHKIQKALELKKTGSYFMYIDLKLTCTGTCKAGLVTVSLDDKLTCEVELPENKNPVSRKCWTVKQVEQNKLLLVQMTAPKEEQQNWKLDLSSSGIGMFLVD